MYYFCRRLININEIDLIRIVMKKFVITIITFVLFIITFHSCKDDDNNGTKDHYYVEYNVRIAYWNRVNRGWDIEKTISYTAPEGQQTLKTKDCSYSIKAGPFEKGDLINFTLSDTSAPATVQGTISVSVNGEPFVEKKHFEGERSFNMTYTIQ